MKIAFTWKCVASPGRTAPGLLDAGFAGVDGIDWWRINAVVGRLTVGLDPDRRTVADVLAVVRTAEAGGGTGGHSWSRHVDLPGDREPLLAAGLALTAVVSGLVVAVVTRPLPVPAGAKFLTAGLALLDAQPRLRRRVDYHLGVARTDLVITAGNAAAQALGRNPSALLVDACQRLALLLELQASWQSWKRWQHTLQGSGGISVTDPLLSKPRPRPLPAGPIERGADRSATGSLVATGIALLGKQDQAAGADVLLAGVPKASRTSRESFACVLSWSLSRQGVLSLDGSAWRRLDRVTAVVLDGPTVRTGPSLVFAAETIAEHWTVEHVWSVGQRLLWLSESDRKGRMEGLSIPPPPGRDASRLTLRHARVSSRAGRPGRPSQRPHWADLLEDGHVVGRIKIGRELHPRADSLLSTARRAGSRVVLAGEEPGSELRSRADELVAPGRSITQTVRRLQEAGEVVLVISEHAHRALAAADVAVGLSPPTLSGPRHVPWSADVVCEHLATIEQIVAATELARAVSQRGRTLALSASALSGLLLIAGPRPGSWHRAVSPITGAALIGQFIGTRSGLRAARPLAAPTTSLTPWHSLETDEVLLRLSDPGITTFVNQAPDHGASTGLSAKLTGLGLLPRSTFRRLVAPLRPVVILSQYMREELSDPLTPVLTVGAAASAILGSPTDAVLVGAVMGVNALVSTLQRQRADQAMQALRLGERVYARRLSGPAARSLTSPSPNMVEERVPAEELRPGDVIVLGTGDLVPADARLLTVQALEIDESGLTGESVTVEKREAATPGAILGERACMVFEGSVVVSGRARAVVVAVGAATQAGRAVAAVPTKAGSGGVQAQLGSLTDKALPLTLGGGAVVSALGFLRGQPLRAAVADGVAVAVAAVPEGLPLVATVAQLAAARRLSRRGVLVRSSRTVEALGRVDTMCFDKTGTLTEGVLRLMELADLKSRWTPSEAEQSAHAQRLLRDAARACPDPRDGPVVHATDRAVLAAATNHLGQQAAHVWDPVEEVPFESNRGYAATLGQSRQALRLIVKGAPEVLLGRCTHAMRSPELPDSRAGRSINAQDQRDALATINILARQGLRVLLVARRELTETPDDLEAAVDKLTLMGFLGLADTPRRTTLPVIAELTANHISVRMITGDHPVTAQAIATQLKIPHQQVVTGAELDRLNETSRRALILKTNVFARVTPEHKVQIVEALQHGGKVVAMTGDGSNDAAAIRLADVGIGLATHGSAAARNAADLVLTSSDLTLLLDALVEGRMMWQRVRDAVAVLVGGNAGEVAFTIFGTALAGRAPVGTRQFLLVNLLTDMFPSMAVALAHRRPPLLPHDERDDRDDEQRRASRAGAELALTPVPELGNALLRSIAIRGTATAAGASSAWLVGRGTGTARRASTMGLVALVGTQLGQTLVLGGRSPLVWLTAVASGAALVAVVQTPGVSQFFGCTPLDPAAWMVVASSASAATAGSVVLPRLLPLFRGDSMSSSTTHPSITAS